MSKNKKILIIVASIIVIAVAVFTVMNISNSSAKNKVQQQPTINRQDQQSAAQTGSNMPDQLILSSQDNVTAVQSSGTSAAGETNNVQNGNVNSGSQSGGQAVGFAGRMQNNREDFRGNTMSGYKISEREDFGSNGRLMRINIWSIVSSLITTVLVWTILFLIAVILWRKVNKKGE